MALNDGILTLCALRVEQGAGKAPKPTLYPEKRCFFGNRVLGYGRAFSAQNVGVKVDRVARVNGDNDAGAYQYALIGTTQYRIALVQEVEDEHRQRCFDLTLERLGTTYDLATES